MTTRRLDSRTTEYMAVVLVLALAAAVRFFALGAETLWLDELFTVSVTSDGLGHALREIASDTNPPLYFALQALLAPLLGRSEAALRVLPAFIGVLTTGAIYLLGRRLFDRWVGLVGALLFAVTPFAVEYAQEARPYSLLMLFAAVSMLAFVHLAEKPTPGSAVWFGLSLSGLLYTHVYGYLAAASFLIVVLAQPRLRARTGRLMPLAYSVAAVAFLPWAFVLVGQVRQVLEASAAGSWWGEPVEQVVTEFVDRFMHAAPGDAIIPSLLFVVLFAMGLPVHTRETLCSAEQTERRGEVTEDDLSWALLATALLPVLLGLAISKYLTPVAASRNAVVAVPAICLIVGRGVSRVPARTAAVLVAVLVGFSAWTLSAYYPDRAKGHWREATEFALARSATAGVIAETREGALQYATYAELLGTPDAQVVWAEEDDKVAGGVELELWGDDDADVSIEQYLRSRDSVVVLLPWAEPGPVDEYLSEQSGWFTDDYYDGHDPVVKVWRREK